MSLGIQDAIISVTAKLFFVPYRAWHPVVVEINRCCDEAGHRRYEIINIQI